MTRKPREKTPEQAIKTLEWLCSKAEKSSGDALRLMSRWGIAPDERQRILKRLTDDRFIDDRRYAAAFVREKMRFSGWGAHKIRQALAAKRIDRGIIAEAMSALDPEALQGRLAELLRRKMHSVKAETAFELKGKLMRYGLSQGYDYDTVIPVVERLVREREE